SSMQRRLHPRRNSRTANSRSISETQEVLFLQPSCADYREATVKRATKLAASLCLVGLGLVGTASKASAASVIYSATTTSLTNMTHQNGYTWELEGINLGSNTITSAVLTFNGFFNWTSATSDPYNILWVDLLDTSTHTGNGTVASMTDDTNGGTLGINDVLD